MDAVQTLEGEVRELIRRSGLDPARDEGEVRRLVREAVADYDERSLPRRDAADRRRRRGVARRCWDTRGRLRPAAAVLRRPVGRGDLGQRARRGCSSPADGVRRADDDPAGARPGARPRRADAEVVGPPGRPQLARSSTPCSPTAAGCTSSSPTSPASTGTSTSASSWSRPTRWTTSSRLGTLTRQAARFLEAAVAAGLNVLVAGGTQAGKTTLLNCLAAAVPAARAHRHLRGGLRAADPAPRRRVDAVPPALPRGHRRDPAAPAGQGGAADAALAHRRRRGAPGREPRPAHRAELRACPACAPSTPTAPARPSRRCARCRCSRARTCRVAFVVPTVAASIDLVVHAGARARRAAHGARDRRRSGPGRGRRRRDRRPLRPRAAAPWCGPTAFPPHADRFDGPATTCPLCSPRVQQRDRPAPRAAAGHRPVPRLAELLGALGAPAPRRRRPGPLDRLGDEIVQAGFAGLSVRTLLTACVVRVAARPRAGAGHGRRAADRRVLRRDGRLPPAGGRPGPRPASPRAAARPVAGCRRQPRLRRPRRACRCPRRCRSWAPRARRSCAQPFRRSPTTTGSTGRFHDCLDRLKDGLADPVGDRIVETPADRPRGGRHRPRPPAAHAVGVPARGRPHPRRARDPAGLDGQRGPAGGRRTVGRARAAVDPAPSRWRPTTPARRRGGAGRRRRGLPPSPTG